MPQIDVYTAPSKPVTPDQPMAFMESGANPAKGVEQQSKLLGHQLSVIAGNVVAQQDSVDFGLANANYLAAPKRIGMDVAKDPEVIENPLLYEKQYNEKRQKYKQRIIEETPNTRSHGAIPD